MKALYDVDGASSAQELQYRLVPAVKLRWKMAASFQGFRSLVENSPDAISLIDPQGEVLYASKSTTKVLGYQPEELVGRNGWDLIHPEDRAQSSRVLQTLLSQPPGPLQWDARVRCKD